MDPISRIPRFRQRSLHSWKRRAGRLWRRHVLHRFVDEKRVFRVEIAGRVYKRVVFPDASGAAAAEANLAVFEGRGLFPRPVQRVGRELLLEWVEGEVPARFGPRHVEPLAAFFAALYREAPRRVAAKDAPHAAELAGALAFLRDVGVVSPRRFAELAAAAAERMPETLWVGFDHRDPLPRNFATAADGRLVAVDVEEVLPDQLLGGGLAKAALRGGVPRDALLAAVGRRAALDLAPSLPFVELHFRAVWTARAYLKGRHKLVDASLLGAF